MSGSKLKATRGSHLETVRVSEEMESVATKGAVLVIGSGAAGASAARALAATGWSVTIADQDRIGGTCLWRGCIPKKAVYAAARSAREIRRAPQFGVGCGEPQVDWQGVLGWKWHAAETFAGNQEAAFAARGIRVVKAAAAFASPDELLVGSERVAPDHVVLATGSAPVLPPVPGIELADDSDAVLRYPELPASLVIIGAGFISIELAGIFASLGTRVTVVQRSPRILTMLDAELAQVAHRRLESMGVRVITDANVVGIESVRGGLGVHVFDATNGEEALSCERVAIAAGRAPVLDGLDLEDGGVEVDDSGHLVLDRFLRTTNPKVWAAGDVAGGVMETPVANMEGRSVASSIDTGVPVAPDCSAVPSTCFATPQLASVGLTQARAADQGIPVCIRRVDAASVGAAVVDDERDSFWKLVAREADDLILGGQIAGPTACDAIYSIAVAMAGGLTTARLREVIAVHPSYAEGVFFSAW